MEGSFLRHDIPSSEGLLPSLCPAVLSSEPVFEKTLAVCGGLAFSHPLNPSGRPTGRLLRRLPRSTWNDEKDALRQDLLDLGSV